MSKDSNRLEPVVDEAIQALKKVFQTEEADTQALAIGRMASSVLATWAKLKQSERAQEALYFNMARALAADKEQLAHYIEVSMPDAHVNRMLEAGSSSPEDG